MSNEILVPVPFDLLMDIGDLACSGVAHGPYDERQKRVALRKLERLNSLLDELLKDD